MLHLKCVQKKKLESHILLSIDLSHVVAVRYIDIYGHNERKCSNVYAI